MQSDNNYNNKLNLDIDTNRKITHNQVLKLATKLSHISWKKQYRHYQQNYHHISSSSYYNYWLHYKNSITQALKQHNFKVRVLYNQQIQGIWHRHVLLYAFNRPFMYAITHTKSPITFGLSSLGGSSLGSLLFKNYIYKSEFEFCSTNILKSMHKNYRQLYGRKRIYKKKNAELILYEFLL
jgi:chorismate-pyruvate lyase